MSTVFPDMPQLLVEIGFTNGAQTGAYWHIEDAARGRIGTFALPGEEVWTDVSSYALAAKFTSGASSRVSAPIVEWEAGTLEVPLDNGLRPDGVYRAFDPFNTASPFYVGETDTVIPLPGTLTQPSVAPMSFTANDAQAATSQTNAVSVAPTSAPMSIAGNNATATGLSSGSSPDGYMFGSSGFASAAAATSTINLLNPYICRCYEKTSTASVAGTTYLRHVPSGHPVLITFKGTTAAWANPASDPTTYAAEVSNVLKVLRGMENIAGHAASFHHEPIGDMSGADWAACNINFRHDVLDVVNADAGRTHKIWCAPVMNGFVPNTGGTTGTLGPENMATYWPNSLLAVTEIMNWDCYGFGTNPPGSGPDQVARLHNYATSRGLAWGVGELGVTTNPGNTDSMELNQCMKPYMTYVNGLPVSERPIHTLWFNSGNNLLNTLTQSANFWNGVCTNSTVPATV